MLAIINDKAKVQFCKGCPAMGQDSGAPHIKPNDNQILVKNINLEYLADMKISCHACGVYAANRPNLLELYVL